MAKLTITRGLPGSGKTTWALEQHEVWRVNRDALRKLYTGTWRYGDDDLEDPLTEAQYAMVRAMLLNLFDVIVDDTNFRLSVVEDLREIAAECGAEFEIKDFTGFPVETCIERDAARPSPERVGAEVIWAMYYRYIAAGQPFCHPEAGPMPGYVVGQCGHRVAESEWRAGFRKCERC